MLHGRFDAAHQFRFGQGADFGERRGVPDQARVTHQPFARAVDHPDAAVAQRRQVGRDTAGAGHVRGGDGGDVRAQRRHRVDHDEGQATRAQDFEFFAGLRRQHHDRAGDAGVGGQRRERHGMPWAGAGAEDEAAAVQVEGLGDRRDDQAEVVGERVGTVHVYGPGVRPAGVRGPHGQPFGRLAHQFAGGRGDRDAAVHHPGDRGDRDPRLGGDGPHGGPGARSPSHALHHCVSCASAYPARWS